MLHKSDSIFRNMSNATKKLLISIVGGIAGSLLAYLSSLLSPLQPQLTFDFSHLATFAVAIAFGPWYGLLTAAIGSIYPYIEYAVLGIYGPLAGIGIIIGKSLTGLTCGFLRKRLPTFFAIIVSFIPECLFILGFLWLMLFYLPLGVMTWYMIGDIILEAWVEVIIFAIIIETVVRRRIMETAVIMLEIFIIMLLVHQQLKLTLLALLLIVVVTVLLFELIKQYKNKRTERNTHDDDDLLI